MSETSLADLQRDKRYLIAGFNESVPAYAEKLFKMGFIVGTPVQLSSVASNDPIILEIRGSRIALRKNEAKHIYVKEQCDA